MINKIKFKLYLLAPTFIFVISLPANATMEEEATIRFESKESAEQILELHGLLIEHKSAVNDLGLQVSKNEEIISNIEEIFKSNTKDLDSLEKGLVEIKTAVREQINQTGFIGNQVSILKDAISNQELVLESQKLVVERQQTEIERVDSILDENRVNFEEKISSLEQELKKSKQENHININRIDKDFKINNVYWISAVAVLFVLLSMISWLLYRRIILNKNNIETQIRNTRNSLEEEAIKLDGKLLDIFETQLKIKEEIKNVDMPAQAEGIDHSLALKVADEIVRMQKNIARMDENTKGLNPLNKGVERIRANFAANGYEMITYLNEEYDDRMNIDVIMFVVDESLQEGKKIITKVIKPQVNYNDVLIQRAQVEVSQN